MGLVGRTSVTVYGSAGGHVYLEDAKLGVKVASLAGNGTLVDAEISAVSSRIRPVYEVELDDGILAFRADLDQRFLEYVYRDSKLNWTKRQKLYVGCYLVAQKPSSVGGINRPFTKPYEKYFPEVVYPAKITSIKPAGIDTVWALKIGSTHNFFGNGVVCHA